MATITVLILQRDKEVESSKPPPTPEKVWSLPELAHLMGEMQALREHPDTMPDYQEEWALNVSRKAIQS